MIKTVMYRTDLRWQLHDVGMLAMHYGSVIRIYAREPYGDDYMRITYEYVG